MNNPESELRESLTGQPFVVSGNESRLDDACRIAEGYAEATGGIAVVSDFVENRSYVYAGSFGKSLGLAGKSVGDSFLEEEVFANVSEEDLLGRHILELRFLSFIKTMDAESRTDFYQRCILRFSGLRGKRVAAMHTTRYLHCQIDGTPTLGLCTYLPVGDIASDNQEAIVRMSTGEAIEDTDFSRNLLTGRQIEILQLLSKGVSSKEIANHLNISTHTVNRHRQDLYLKLNAKNTSEAVRIGLKLHLI